MSTFAFIPRTVSKGTRSILPQSIVSSTKPLQREQTNNSISDDPKGKTKADQLPEERHPSRSKYPDDDYANLLFLALSDYALWIDPDLRRVIELNNKSGPSDQGFIPLTHILRSSKLLAPLCLWDVETSIAKALRSHLDILEVRLLISGPSTSSRFGGLDVGGYEIRRKDWGSAREHLSRSQWEERTIYMENIPIQFRTIAGIARFSLALLLDNPNPHVHRTRIQNIVLPSHHQDKPGDQPSCKGFAVLTLAKIDDAKFFQSKWPWSRAANSSEKKPHGCIQSTESQEAMKFGFRTLSKSKWDDLKQEYLAYRGRLVEEINIFEDAEPLISVPSASTPEPTVKLDSSMVPSKEPSTQDDWIIDPTSPYPTNSLVFVRNVHPETNKTTLRKFFARAFETSLANGQVESDGLDYVDFNKGIDSCHLRLTTPKHAQILMEHFSTTSLCQPTGLADVGSPTDSPSKLVSMELVLGKREEVYWGKVPEKVRKEAVRRAVNITQLEINMEDQVDTQDINTINKKRKRRR